MTAIGIMIELT